MKPGAFQVDKLAVRVFPDRAAAGAAAAQAATDALREALARQGAARVLLASAPSQDELLDGLARAEGIEWKRVIMFHLDEYIGLPESHPASFRAYLRRSFLRRVTPGMFHGIAGEAKSPEAECARYAALLGEAPIDLACLGVGENGHIAFNDPPADFQDPAMVKIVALDEASRRQQVHDGCFAELASVPRRAITLTCPAIMPARRLICIAPGAGKTAAIAAMLTGSIRPDCPASILRAHPAAVLFLDKDSGARILGAL